MVLILLKIESMEHLQKNERYNTNFGQNSRLYEQKQSGHLLLATLYPTNHKHLKACVSWLRYSVKPSLLIIEHNLRYFWHHNLPPGAPYFASLSDTANLLRHKLQHTAITTQYRISRKSRSCAAALVSWTFMGSAGKAKYILNLFCTCIKFVL